MRKPKQYAEPPIRHVTQFKNEDVKERERPPIQQMENEAISFSPIPIRGDERAQKEWNVYPGET